jgi:hypothetical protein
LGSSRENRGRSSEGQREYHRDNVNLLRKLTNSGLARAADDHGFVIAPTVFAAGDHIICSDSTLSLLSRIEAGVYKCRAENGVAACDTNSSEMTNSSDHKLNLSANTTQPYRLRAVKFEEKWPTSEASRVALRNFYNTAQLLA